jgi:uncharacterized membrane protein HdeD (DUF308 family)
MPKDYKFPSKDRSTLFVGLIAILAGLFVVLVSVDVIHTDPESFHAPRWVVTFAGLTFVCAGLLLLSQNLFSSKEHRDPIVMWIQYLLTTGMMTAFSSIFLWVGFGPGEREFSTSGSFLFFTVSGAGDELIGRILFGGAGLLVGAFTVFAAIRGVNRILHEADR